jgi:dihydroorotate dehydrogenase electron transfer subunit
LDYRIAGNELRITRVLNVEFISPSVKMFTFKDEQCAKSLPGQFLMLWVPGVDEIPISLLEADDKQGNVSIAVKNVGAASSALHKVKAGGLIGVRGPFGSSFTLNNGSSLIVAGGTGTAPLLFLAKKLSSRMKKSFFVLGAKTKNELLFSKRLEQILAGSRTRIESSTEDGTCGITGLCTSIVEELLRKEKFDMIYSCGPERMIRRVFELAEQHRTPMEASLERLMRCAIGLCGSCAIGKFRVCRDGPVFDSSQLREVQAEFGVSKKDMTGRTVPLE